MTEVKICKKCGGEIDGARCKPCAKEYRERPGVKERLAKNRAKHMSGEGVREAVNNKKKERRKCPEIKENIKKYWQEYGQRAEVKERIKNYCKALSEKRKSDKIIKIAEPKICKKCGLEKPGKYCAPCRKSYLNSDDYRLYKSDYDKKRLLNPEIRELKKNYLKEYYSIPENKERFWGSHHGRVKKRGGYAERVIRIEVFKRDKFTCEYCKKKFPLKDCVLEHRIPVAMGGSNTWENCTTSCAPCNGKKAAKLLNGVQITIFDKVKE